MSLALTACTAPAPTSPSSSPSPTMPTSTPASPTTDAATSAPPSEPSPSPSAPDPSGTPAASDGDDHATRHFSLRLTAIATRRATVGPDQRGWATTATARVCVVRLPDDSERGRTRISPDPWSVQSASGSTPAFFGMEGGGEAGEFGEGRYRVGQCQSGRLTFLTTDRPSRIRYENSLGETANWTV